MYGGRKRLTAWMDEPEELPVRWAVEPASRLRSLNVPPSPRGARPLCCCWPPPPPEEAVWKDAAATDDSECDVLSLSRRCG